MNNVTERLIARVENAINVGAEVEDIIQLLAGHGVTGYDAWLAYKAAEVSIRLFNRDLKSAKQNAPTRQMRAVRDGFTWRETSGRVAGCSKRS